MSIRFFVNKSKTKVFWLDIGRRTPISWCAYPVSFGFIWLDENDNTKYASIKHLGKFKK